MMRAFAAILAMITGAVVFAGDPTSFSRLDYATIPGNMIVGGGLFMGGVLLWLRGIY